VTTIGKVESLWRYPVKSMRGEELDEGFMGFSGFYGDRMFAFTSSAAPKGFPFFTGREQSEMLRYRPRFRNAGGARQPTNLAEASDIGPGVTPVYADLAVDVETPSGEVLPVDDPALVGHLTEGLGDKHSLALARSDRSMTDCRPVSLFSLQTAKKIGEEIEADVDKRRFRANIYVDLASGGGFAENDFVGRSLRVGSKAVISVLERDPRCKMITLDPDTAESNPEVLRTVAKAHNSMAGVYAAVLVEGMVRKGDEIELIS
jgi:uncharacterized protein YcbX